MTNEQLVIAAQGGDKAAEELIFTKFSPLVKSIAARYFLFGGETEDLVQEGMVGLYSAVNGYNAGGAANFSTYAFSCIKNAVVDAVKKSNGAKYSALNNYISLVDLGENIADYSVEDEILRRENKREFLQRLSGQLSPLEAKVLLLHLDGETAADMAELFEVSPKSVSNALARAKRKLKKAYETEE